MNTEARSGWTWKVLVVLIAAFFAFRLVTGRAAPVPPGFDKTVTLAAAQQRSAESGKPVLAFATADWCGPCKSMKRGTLRDEGVSARIIADTVPLYVDATSTSPDAMALGVQVLPTFLLLKGGREVTRAEGTLGETEFLAWLDDGLKKSGG